MTKTFDFPPQPKGEVCVTRPSPGLREVKTGQTRMIVQDLIEDIAAGDVGLDER